MPLLSFFFHLVTADLVLALIAMSTRIKYLPSREAYWGFALTTLFLMAVYVIGEIDGHTRYLIVTIPLAGVNLAFAFLAGLRHNRYHNR